MAAARKMSKALQQKRIRSILLDLDRAYPDAKCALDHGNAFELLAHRLAKRLSTDRP